MLQSIYTHAGCDEIGHPVWTLFDVSIHTPTQGVTQRAMLYAIPIQVSIHTPTQGVTIDWHPLQYGCQFQSTHPRRVWRIGFIKPHEIQRFQSTHPRRVWLWWCVMAHHVFEFQSTHPRRVWLYIQLCLWLWIRFNPHTHAGCDGASQTDSKCKTVSIHTPTQGVTRTSCAWNTAVHVSIHTPTQGVTISQIFSNLHSRFQSTHPRRVWLLYSVLLNK